MKRIGLHQFSALMHALWIAVTADALYIAGCVHALTVSPGTAMMGDARLSCMTTMVEHVLMSAALLSLFGCVSACLQRKYR